MDAYARCSYDYDRRRKVADADSTVNPSEVLPALHQIVERTRQRITEIDPDDRHLAARVAAILKFSFDFMRRAGAGLVFLEVLREYGMPAADRKLIERAAKNFSKTRIVVKPAKVLEVWEDTLYEWQQAIDTAFSALRSNERHKDEGSSTTLESGSFQLVNTGGFSAAVMAECAKVVAKAEKLLRQKGLGKVCYGDVHVTNTVHRSTRTLAFYLQNNDTLYIRANLKGKLGPALQSVLHELAHRLQFKFLKSKKREIDALYRRLGDNQSENLRGLLKDRSLWPKEGETFEHKGETFVFDKVSLSSRNQLEAHFRLPGSDRFTLRLSLSGYISEKYPEALAGAKTYVTRYAGTDPDENFAEMVAFYCEGKLPSAQEPLLTAILD